MVGSHDGFMFALGVTLEVWTNGGYGQNVDVFHLKRCEDIPDATSSQNGLFIDAHPKMTKDVSEETRSPAQQVYKSKVRWRLWLYTLTFSLNRPIILPGGKYSHTIY